MSLVGEREAELETSRDVLQAELDFQTLLINRLQESGAKFFIHLKTSPHDPITLVFEDYLHASPSFLFLFFFFFLFFVFFVCFVVKFFFTLRAGDVDAVRRTSLRTAPKVLSVVWGRVRPSLCTVGMWSFSRRRHTNISPKRHPFFVVRGATTASLR